MPLIPNFSITQTVSTPSIIDIEDTSTGSDVAITQRRVYLQASDGSYLVPTGVTTEYNAWLLANTTVSIDCLTKDYALKVVVQWLNVSNTVLYDKTIYYGFALYGETFDYGLTQNLAANPTLSNDNNFMNNKELIRNFMDSGNNAIAFNSDTFSAQICYDKVTDMISEAQYLFNTNG